VKKIPKKPFPQLPEKKFRSDIKNGGNREGIPTGRRKAQIDKLET